MGAVSNPLGTTARHCRCILREDGAARKEETTQAWRNKINHCNVLITYFEDMVVDFEKDTAFHSNKNQDRWKKNRNIYLIHFLKESLLTSETLPLAKVRTWAPRSYPEVQPGSAASPAGPPETQLREMDSDCPPGQRLRLLLLEASEEHRVKWNRTSTAEIDLCGLIYTSGLQTPRLTSLHSQLRAVRRGPR